MSRPIALGPLRFRWWSWFTVMVPKEAPEGPRPLLKFERWRYSNGLTKLEIRSYRFSRGLQFWFEEGK